MSSPEIKAATSAAMFQQDRFSLRPTYVLALLFVIVGTTDSMSPGGFGLFANAIMLLTALVWLPLTLIQTLAAARQRTWRRFLSLLAAIVVIYPMYSNFREVGDYIHLAFAYPFYSKEIAAARSASRSVKFDWGKTGFAGFANQDFYLIYDQTDIISSEIGFREIRHTPIKIYTNHLVGHFYTAVYY